MGSEETLLGCSGLELLQDSWLRNCARGNSSKLRFGTAAILWCWALQGESGAGRCMEPIHFKSNNPTVKEGRKARIG